MPALECNEDGEGKLSKRKRKTKTKTKTKKRKEVSKSKKFGKKKLAVGETVEVRHFDKGLRGSWSTGVVIKSEKSVRHVEYVDLFCNDGSSKLIEAVCVSPTVDGMPSNRTKKTVRGNIRPSPTCFCIESPKFCYGLCVDALINHGWWEGVIFDHEEGAGKRLIFFPDEGDQVMVDVVQLRVSQDWDEGSGEWKCRGEWLFLCFLRNMKQWGSFPVSIRQIWYDLRANISERIDLDWTCRNESLWGELVLKALEENALAAKGKICSFSDYFPKKYLAALKSSKKTSKLLVATSSVCSGCRMDEFDLHVFDERDKTKQKLASGRSKRKKTQMGKRSKALLPQNFASMSIPELPAEEPFTCSEDLCIDQGKVSHPILVSQPGMGAATFEHGFQVSSMDVIDAQMGDHQKILSAPAGWSRADISAPGKHLANATHKTRKSCMIQSLASTLVSGDETVDHVVHQRLQNTNQCTAQKDHLCHDILRLPSEPSATLHITNIQDSYLDDGLPPSGQAMVAFQLDPGSCPPSHPEAFPEYLSFKCSNNLDGKCCTFLKEQEVNGQSSASADGSMANHSSCDVSHLLMMNTEPACFVKESVEIARVSGTSLYNEEHSSWTVEDTLSNANAKAHGIHKGTSQSFTQMTGSDGLLDTDIQAILLPEILDKQEDAEDGHCSVEENHACGSLKPQNFVDFGSEYCPEAVIDYYNNYKLTGTCKHNGFSEDTKKIRLKAKRHLAADGWTFWYTLLKRNKRELRYGQPNGRSFHSLRSACKAWIDANWIISRPAAAVSPAWEVIVSKGSKGPSADKKAVNFVKTASTCFKLKRSKPSNGWAGPGWSVLNRPRLGSVRLTGARKCRRRRRSFHSDFTVSQCLPYEMNAQVLSLPAISENVKPSGLPMLCGKTIEHLPYRFSASQKRRKRKSSAGIIRYRRSNSRSLTCVLRSSKRAPQASLSSSQLRSRTIFSWLIDNEVVLPRQKVCYVHGKDRCVLAKGQITRSGIKCKCCKKVFSLTGFELHAGSNNHRPAAHIILEDGRSLLECQIKLLHSEKLKGLGSDTGARIKRDCHRRKTDNICSICRYGGKLVLCDFCPSSFHLSCINLKEVPEGRWACPTCQCSICGLSDFNGKAEQFTEKTVLYCDQCRHEYHVGCLRKRGMRGLESCPDGNWFCSNKCSKIFMRIQRLVGKRKQTDVAGLSCTLLRPRRNVNCSLDTSEAESTVELHSKLSVALSILHECFVPIIEPRTQRDLVTDVIFNQGLFSWVNSTAIPQGSADNCSRFDCCLNSQTYFTVIHGKENLILSSELKRLNFGGFYTMILEGGDELISVATVRIHGVKAAEMPLIGTSVQYRQQGMCRLLVNELEKMLFELGVERLLLPATSQMLPKWTSSFGFTQVAPSERLRLLGYTFLDFQGTTMCQKVLQPPLLKPPQSSPGGKKNKAQYELCCADQTGSGKQSSISEMTETVGPVLGLLSMDAQVHPLHDEDGTGEETMDHSSWGNDRSSSEELPQDGKLRKSKMAEASIKFSTGGARGDAGIVEAFPRIDLLKQKTVAQERYFGLSYQRKRKLDIMRKHKRSSSATSTERRDINRFVNHYKRRRVSTPEVSSSQPTG